MRSVLLAAAAVLIGSTTAHAQLDTAAVLSAVAASWRLDIARSDSMARECLKRTPACLPPLGDNAWKWRWHAFPADRRNVVLLTSALNVSEAEPADGPPVCAIRRQRLLSVGVRQVSSDSAVVRVFSRCTDPASPQAPPAVREVVGFSVRRASGLWVARLHERMKP